MPWDTCSSGFAGFWVWMLSWFSSWHHAQIIIMFISFIPLKAVSFYASRNQVEQEQCQKPISFINRRKTKEVILIAYLETLFHETNWYTLVSKEIQNVWGELCRQRSEWGQILKMEETQERINRPLPIGNIFKKALRFLFCQNQQFWIWVVILCLVSFVITRAGNYFVLTMLADLPIKVRIGISAVLGGLGNGLVFTLLAIACHRMILLEEKKIGGRNFFNGVIEELDFSCGHFLSTSELCLYSCIQFLLGHRFFCKRKLILLRTILSLWTTLFLIGSCPKYGYQLCGSLFLEWEFPSWNT